VPSKPGAVPDGRKIRYFRVRKYRTQRALARASGHSQKLISTAESGRGNHSLAALCDIAEALDVEVEEILAA
jgi:transcriptional regulator with XRE-family HTH domain